MQTVNYIYAAIRVALDKSYDYIEYYFREEEEEEVVGEEEVEVVGGGVVGEEINKIIKFDKFENEKTSKRLFKSYSLYEEYTTFFDSPTHIIDNIYLGSAFNAASYYKLVELDIKIVINVTKEISHYYPDDFVYINYNLYDNNADSISEYLEVAYKEIEKFKSKNILIHCYMGASRSATIVLYYLMKKYKMTHENAINFIKEKRHIVNPTFKLTKDVATAIMLD